MSTYVRCMPWWRVLVHDSDPFLRITELKTLKMLGSYSEDRVH